MTSGSRRICRRIRRRWIVKNTQNAVPSCHVSGEVVDIEINGQGNSLEKLTGKKLKSRIQFTTSGDKLRGVWAIRLGIVALCEMIEFFQICTGFVFGVFPSKGGVAKVAANTR